MKEHSFTEEIGEVLKADGPALVEKFVIRLPAGLRDQIRKVSEQNRRSMNSEILLMIEDHIQSQLQEKFMAANLNDGFAPGKRVELNLTSRLDALPTDKKEALLKLLM